MLTEIEQDRLYAEQFGLLQYLQEQVRHPSYIGGVLYTIGTMPVSSILRPDGTDIDHELSVSFISDAGFERNPLFLPPQFMQYIHILHQEILDLRRTDDQLISELTVRGTRVQVLPAGKPVVLGRRQ